MNELKILTKRQKNVLKFISDNIRFRQTPPTIREIGKHFGFSSTGTVRDHLRALRQKGYIKTSAKKSRAIELVKEALCQIPVLGRVRAGMPVYAVEDLEGYINLDKLIFPDPDIFALRVKGDSMAEAGIMPDDFVLIKRQQTAQSGEIVVALIEDEVTIKTLSKKQGRYFLEPANPKYQPIAVTNDVSLIGKVIHVVRHYL